MPGQNVLFGSFDSLCSYPYSQSSHMTSRIYTYIQTLRFHHHPAKQWMDHFDPDEDPSNLLFSRSFQIASNQIPHRIVSIFSRSQPMPSSHSSLRSTTIDKSSLNPVPSKRKEKRKKKDSNPFKASSRPPKLMETNIAKIKMVPPMMYAAMQTRREVNLSITVKRRSK